MNLDNNFQLLSLADIWDCWIKALYNSICDFQEMSYLKELISPFNALTMSKVPYYSCLKCQTPNHRSGPWALLIMWSQNKRKKNTEPLNDLTNFKTWVTIHPDWSKGQIEYEFFGNTSWRNMVNSGAWVKFLEEKTGASCSFLSFWKLKSRKNWRSQTYSDLLSCS